MQRAFSILAYIFILVIIGIQNLFAQQYPFIYYTPNNGLINSRVKSIKQDSKGFMYFITHGGLSIYDGARFVNYSQQNGLANEIVNDIVEITPDSFLVATNVSSLNTLAKGRIGNFKTSDNFCPVINRFFKNKEGSWYVAADEGLFVFDGKRFNHIHLFDDQGKEIGQNINMISQWNNFLLLSSWSSLIKEKLIVYDMQQKKVSAIETNRNVLSTTVNLQGQLWVTTDQGVFEIDTTTLKKGKLNYLLPGSKILALTKQYPTNVFFDNENNIWFYNKDSIYKLSPDGRDYRMILSKKGMNTTNLSDIFIDREGITWIAIDGAGIAKLTNSGVEMINALNGTPSIITSIFQQRDSTWLYNNSNNKLYCITPKGTLVFPLPEALKNIENIFVRNEKLYLINQKRIVSVSNKNNPQSYRHPELIFSSENFSFGTGLADPYGNIIIEATKDASSFYIYVISNKKIIEKYSIGLVADQIVLDGVGRLWVITRKNQLMVFTLHPDDPSNYLRLLKDYSGKLPDFSPRSLIIDKENNAWIGTRYHGVYYIRFDGLRIDTVLQLTTKNGLTDNFIYTLTYDSSGNIWAGTQTGLDKIFLKNGHYVISNVSKNNNFFQSVHKISITNDNTVLALLAEGSLLKIVPGIPKLSGSVPQLLITNMNVNGIKYNESSNKFTFHQNNFSFSIAAPSYLDEKSIRYSYLLEGSGTNNWSEPSNQSDFIFINLTPASYTLKVKSYFPGELYPTQMISYPFSIAPPWWQTWWFRIFAFVFILVLMISAVRFYFKRKLEVTKALLEKQQAVEKERTRIATDMHDDLGAGLSRIKFLSETIGIKKQKNEPIEEDINKIRNYSHEMIDKMGEIVWALNEKNDTLSDLLSYTRSYAVEYLSQNGIQCSMEAPDQFPQDFISGEVRRNIFLSVKEALHNVVKHAQANFVTLKINSGKQLEITIMDNGIGFDKKNIRPFSNGLFNMEKRIQEIGGSLIITTWKGTTVFISVPLKA